MKDKRKTVLRLVLPAAAMFLVWSLYASRCLPEVTEYTVSSPRLPEAFDGYRIVQLSDLHAREFGEGNRDLVEQVRALAPDLIALTGDYIESEADIPITQSLVAQLTDIAPVYFSSGNHDWASGAAPELREAVEDAGGVWLSNESREVSRDGASILVAGVEDPNSYADMVRPDELLGRIDGDHPGSFILLPRSGSRPMGKPLLRPRSVVAWPLSTSLRSRATIKTSPSSPTGASSACPLWAACWGRTTGCSRSTTRGCFSAAGM